MKSDKNRKRKSSDPNKIKEKEVVSKDYSSSSPQRHKDTET
jgi:hypothetical protein